MEQARKRPILFPVDKTTAKLPAVTNMIDRVVVDDENEPLAANLFLRIRTS